ncbi:MAG: hypothetical protein MZV63_11685 [Marinilabiliales bacterium]|nr:hypothetical protein [Marinilabiliales bacterium]
MMNGEYKTFHPSGELKVTGNFKADKVEGKVTWHTIFGIPVRTLVYNNDTIEGEAVTHYDSSQPKEVYSYVKGEITRKARDLLCIRKGGNSGLVRSRVHFTGDYIEYHPNGRLSVKGTYKQGKGRGGVELLVVKRKTYMRIQSFNAGIVTGLVQTFCYNGMPETEANHSRSGKQDGLTKYFDHRERKYLEEDYRDGLLVKMTSDFSNPENPAISGSADGTFSYKVYTADGGLRSRRCLHRG